MLKKIITVVTTAPNGQFVNFLFFLQPLDIIGYKNILDIKQPAFGWRTHCPKGYFLVREAYFH